MSDTNENPVATEGREQQIRERVKATPTVISIDHNLNCAASFDEMDDCDCGATMLAFLQAMDVIARREAELAAWSVYRDEIEALPRYAGRAVVSGETAVSVPVEVANGTYLVRHDVISKMPEAR